MQRLLFFALASAAALALLLAGPATAHARPPRGYRGFTPAGYDRNSYVVYYDASPNTVRVSYREILVVPVRTSGARVSFYNGGNGGNGAAAAPTTVIRVFVPRSDVLPLSEFGNTNFPAMSQ